MYRLKERIPTAKEKKQRAAYLLSKTVTDEHGCMIWQGYIKRDYGTATVFNFLDSVHRHIYRLMKGRINKGMNVVHTCHRFQCINPEHLILKNKTEMIKHITIRSAHARSRRCGNFILKDEDYEGILELVKTDMGYLKIGKKFGVSRERISQIARKNGIRRNKIHAKSKAKTKSGTGKKETDICSSCQI